MFVKVLFSSARSVLLTQTNNTIKQCCDEHKFLISRAVSSFRFPTLCKISQSEDDSDAVPLGKGDKVIKAKLQSTRLDAVLKAGLQISRNKIEKAFYEDRIRLNGERPRKKSQMMSEGDEVDIVRGQNQLNSLFIDISRVELLEVGGAREDDSDDSSLESDAEEDKIPAKLKRYKMLTIENYDEPWKGNNIDDK